MRPRRCSPPGRRRRRVTGTSSGTGAVVAEALVDLGAEVHAAASRRPAVETAGFHPLDLSDPASIQAAAERIGGPVDVLFNCAGAVPAVPPLDVLEVSFLGTRCFTELLLQQIPSGGSVENASSDGGCAWRKKHALLLELLVTTTFGEGVQWYERHEEAARARVLLRQGKSWTCGPRSSPPCWSSGGAVTTTSPGAVQTPMLDAIEFACTAAAIDPLTVPSGCRSTAAEQVGPLLLLGGDGASCVSGADIQADGGTGATLSAAEVLWASEVHVGVDRWWSRD